VKGEQMKLRPDQEEKLRNAEALVAAATNRDRAKTLRFVASPPLARGAALSVHLVDFVHYGFLPTRL
jgi:hypothetical protein